MAAWVQDGFHRFLGPYLRRHFDSIAVSGEGQLDAEVVRGGPLLIAANHPSWWDPLVAHFLNRHLLPDRQFRAPIDAAALQQYRVFERLGFFGVEADSRRGAAAFLRTGSRVLASSDDALWVTPEGRFADPRDRGADLNPGVAHLCAKTTGGHFVALAMEYVFWNERLPNVLVRFGQPRSLNESNDKAAWSRTVDEDLRTTQAELAEDVVTRDADRFVPVFQSGGGAGFVYDTARRLRSLFGGGGFQARHEGRSGGQTGHDERGGGPTSVDRRWREGGPGTS